MENKIEIDFSKLKEITVSKPNITIWAIIITMVLISVATAIAMIYKQEICNLVVLFLILAFSLIVLCFILYKLESIQFTYEIEEKKADAALRRKLAEEAIMREIKIREKEISDVQKLKQEIDKYKDL